MKRWLGHSLGIGVLGLAGALAHGKYWVMPMALGDESAYLCAAQQVAQGKSPYTECPRYFYPPPLAHAGAQLLERGGPPVLFAALRALVWLGAVSTLWLSLLLTRWSLGARVAVGALLMVVAPPVSEALELGNLSSAVAGLSIAALFVVERSALWAAALLTFAILLKPLPIAIPVLLVAQGLAQWRHDRAGPPRSLVVGALTLVVCAGLFATTGLGPESRFYDDPASSISVFRCLRNAGLVVPPRALFALALAGGASMAAVRAREPRFVAGLALVTCLLSSPFVWNHSWLMVAPIIAVSADRAVTGYVRARSSRSGSREPSRRLLELALVGLGACALATSDAVGELFQDIPRLNAVLLLLLLATPSLLLAYATRRPATVAS